MIKLADRSRGTILFAGVLIIILGIINSFIGIMSIIGSSPNITVLAVILGLLMINAGLACSIGGIGYISQKSWGSKVAFYGAIAIILTSLAGVRQIGGFIIDKLIAIVLMISATWVMWYLSERRLGAFFIISAAEHTILVLIVIMLIYSGPIEVVPEESVPVTLVQTKQEQVKPEERFIPPKPQIKPEKKVALEDKKEEKGKPAEPPKLKIKSTTDTDSGSQAIASLPKLPKTFANVLDDSTGSDVILRSPGPERGVKRNQETVPVFDKEVSSAAKIAKNPEAGIVPSFDSGKGKGGVSVGRDVDFMSSGQKTNIPSSGTPTGAARPGFVGPIKGELAGRKVLRYPPEPDVKGTESGSVTLEIEVDPSGNVIKVRIVEKSGSPRLDRIATEYVKQIRFEELPSNVQQKVQKGEVVINFELVR